MFSSPGTEYFSRCNIEATRFPAAGHGQCLSVRGLSLDAKPPVNCGCFDGARPGAERRSALRQLSTLRGGHRASDEFTSRYSQLPVILSGVSSRRPSRDRPSRARSIFRQHGGVIRTKDALRFGIHLEMLYGMRDSGSLASLGRGLYRLSDLLPLENLTSRGYKAEKEYLVIEGWPVQFLPPSDALDEEALQQAVETEVEGVRT
ncbi:MAG: type IV toxin-antitoxin system AbiEi family antitoxin domain-containing protein [Terriglobia bacterium]